MYCSPPEAIPSEFIRCMVTSVSASFFPPSKMEHALPPQSQGGFLCTSGTYWTTRLEDKLCFDISLDKWPLVKIHGFNAGALSANSLCLPASLRVHVTRGCKKVLAEILETIGLRFGSDSIVWFLCCSLRVVWPWMSSQLLLSPLLLDSGFIQPIFHFWFSYPCSCCGDESKSCSKTCHLIHVECGYHSDFLKQWPFQCGKNAGIWICTVAIYLPREANFTL